MGFLDFRMKEKIKVGGVHIAIGHYFMLSQYSKAGR
jgi:hypothetical protein